MIFTAAASAALLAIGISASAVAPAAGAPAHDKLAASLCASIASAVDAQGTGPLLLGSYRASSGEAMLPEPLRHSAFTYDNALAAIALVACGDVPRAQQIGDALVLAMQRDRTFTDGRLRNAYREGTVKGGPIPLPGWWDAREKHWGEDPYQDGTAAGNVAWGALALLTLHDATKDPRYVQGATRLLTWISKFSPSAPGPDGFTGGFHGYDQVQVPLKWKSTEHNLDIYAAASWLERSTGDAGFKAMAERARAFLNAAFQPSQGFFAIGTDPQGHMRDASAVALDTQLWPLIGVPDGPAAWRQSLMFAQRNLAVDGGFDFNQDRDGLWTEGTAQAALTYRALGQQEKAAQLLATLKTQISPSGYLFASREARITTGLSIGPESKTADFFYYRRPHLGATAWGILAALGWNPFVGHVVRGS